MRFYNIFNWYWIVGASTTQVYSSAAKSYVLVSDATYELWLADGNSPTKISTLIAVLGVIITGTGLLDKTDTTMHRIVEAISLGLNSWTNTDVVAWVEYRRALRAIVNGSDTTSTSIPAVPTYPTGT